VDEEQRVIKLREILDSILNKHNQFLEAYENADLREKESLVYHMINEDAENNSNICDVKLEDLLAVETDESKRKAYLEKSKNNDFNSPIKIDGIVGSDEIMADDMKNSRGTLVLSNPIGYVMSDLGRENMLNHEEPIMRGEAMGDTNSMVDMLGEVREGDKS
jgi:hypothetical protein